MKYAITLHCDDDRSDQAVEQQVHQLSDEYDVPVSSHYLTSSPSRQRMSPSEFRRLGLLQEINRQFLHPLGLAIEMVMPDDVDTDSFDLKVFGAIHDYRDDPEGMIFGQTETFALNRDAAELVAQLREQHREARQKLFGGATIQPLDWKEPNESTSNEGTGPL